MPYCASHHRTNHYEDEHKCHEQERPHLHPKNDPRWSVVGVAILLCAEACRIVVHTGYRILVRDRIYVVIVLESMFG